MGSLGIGIVYRIRAVDQSPSFRRSLSLYGLLMSINFFYEWRATRPTPNCEQDAGTLRFFFLDKRGIQTTVCARTHCLRQHFLLDLCRRGVKWTEKGRLN